MRARLKVLLENVDAIYRSGASAVEEDLTAAYHAAMHTFLQSLDGSITGSVAKIIKGQPADPLHYNIFTNSILRDLDAIYSEVGALDRIITASFNSIIAEREQTLQVSRRVSDKLGTYLLYADPSLGAGYFFGDSFNSPENIDTGTSLLDTDECFLGQNEGVVLLPLDGDPERPKLKSYILNKPSNGSSGNNQETGVVGHNAIEAIGDNEPNTWYEYERVIAYESNIPLILDITITLSDISVINHIHINPINFGTPTPVRVVKLETSKDGLEYTSIKDEVPLKDFTSEDEDNVFELSPATAKFAGEGLYSFLPRKAQFVHIVLEQHTPHPIDTTNGTRLRYAIGLRDINILGRRFKPEGSIISKSFTIDGEARKVALFANENPQEASLLADITHSISENDGAVWRALQPQHRSGFAIPEVIDYNTISEDSIDTDVPVEALRHKIYMKRDPDAFEGNVTLKQEKETQVDIVNVPVGGDFTMNTTQKPIADTVRIILPFYGSYSCPTGRYGSSIQGDPSLMDLDMLEFNVDVPASTSEDSTDILRFDLPFAGFENLYEHIRVFHNGSQIEYCASNEDALGVTVGINSYTSYDTVDGNSKVYFLDKGGRQLQFGYIDSTAIRRGFLPSGGSKIQVCFDGDNPRIELTDQGYILLLSANSDGFAENMSIVSMDHLSTDEAMDHMVEIPAGRDKIIVTKPPLTKMIRPGKYIKLEDFGKMGWNQSSSTPEENVFEFVPDEVDHQLNVGIPSMTTESDIGALPPIFVDDPDTWEIIEYDLDGDVISVDDMIFTDKKDFIDGRQELLTWTGTAWTNNNSAYSFDAYTGNVYIGNVPQSDRKTMFKCKVITATEIPNTKWKYYRHSITGKIDTQKIILNPKYIVTHTKIRTVNDYRDGLDSSGSSNPMKSLQLIGVQDKGHSWFNQRLVKGTVKMDVSIFPAGTQPVEVPFVDGDSELYSLVTVQDEPVILVDAGSSLYTYQLEQITDSQVLSGLPGFAGVRSVSDPNPPVNYFETYVSGTPAEQGEWTYAIDGEGSCTITIFLSPTATYTKEHYISYRYRSTDPGIDISGLYSIDYITGTIHFAEPIINDGGIQFEVSSYSAFYNIAEVVEEGDIKDINEEGHTITLSTSFGMRFLKMSTALKARPAYAKIAYEYYKKSTESLKDLEPYFSPICKDIALKAVTSSTLEEL